jgi:hypothetical protein
MAAVIFPVATAAGQGVIFRNCLAVRSAAFAAERAFRFVNGATVKESCMGWLVMIAISIAFLIVFNKV